MKLTMENEQCHLLGGVFSTLVQATLAFLCVVALVVKRHNEVPQRDWYVWFLDVMKQAIGSSYGHFSNIFLSVFIAGGITDGDECQWYCLTYIADSTFGTVFNITFLKLFEYFMHRCLPNSTTMNFGDYGNPPQLCTIWFPQLVVWMTIVTVAKICTLLIVYQFILPLDVILTFLFKIFVGQPELELIVVMIIIPTMLNTVQFWITDTFLMKRSKEEEESHGDSELGEELMSGDLDASRHSDTEAPLTSLALHTNNLTLNSTTHPHNKKYKGVYRSLTSNSSESDLGGIQMSEDCNTSPSYPRNLHENPGSSMNTIGSSILSYIPSMWSKNAKLERTGSDEKLNTLHTHRVTTPTSPGKSSSALFTVHNEGIHSVNTKSYTPHKSTNITKRGGQNSHHNTSSNSIDPEDMYL